MTAKVRAAGLPINIVGHGLVDALDKLPQARRKALAAQGIVELDGGDIHPHWIARTRFWWRQRFPAAGPSSSSTATSR